MKLLAERIASIMKAPSMEEVWSQMRSWFASDLCFEFEEGINDFCSALVMASGHQYVDSLDEVVEFLGDSVQILGDAIPGLEGVGGTLLGSALTAWPKGRLFFEETKEALTKARRTQELLVSLYEKSGVLAAQVEMVADVLSTTDAPKVACASECIVDMAALQVSIRRQGLMRFTVDCFSDAKVERPLLSWASLLLTAWLHLAGGLLNASCDDGLLQTWASSAKPDAERLKDATARTLGKSQGLFQMSEDNFAQPVPQSVWVCKGIVEWGLVADDFVRLDRTLNTCDSHGEERAQAHSLASGIIELLIPIPCDVVDKVAPFKASPLFSTTSTLSKLLYECYKKSAAAPTNAIQKKAILWHALFRQTDRVVQFGALGI
jgi:hypothetical protein